MEKKIYEKKTYTQNTHLHTYFVVVVVVVYRILDIFYFLLLLSFFLHSDQKICLSDTKYITDVRSMNKDG